MKQKSQVPSIWLSPIECELTNLIDGHRALVALQLRERIMPKIAWIAFLMGAAEVGKAWIPSNETDLVVDWARDWVLRNRDEEGPEAEHWRTLSKYVSDPLRHSNRFRFNAQYAIAQVNNAFWKRKALNKTYRLVDAIHDVCFGSATGLLPGDPSGALIYGRQHLEAGTLIEHWSFADVDYDPGRPRFEITLEFCVWCINCADAYPLVRRRRVHSHLGK